MGWGHTNILKKGPQNTMMIPRQKAQRDLSITLTFMDVLSTFRISHGFDSMKFFILKLQKKERLKSACLFSYYCCAGSRRNTFGSDELVNLNHSRQMVWDCGKLI